MTDSHCRRSPGYCRGEDYCACQCIACLAAWQNSDVPKPAPVVEPSQGAEEAWRASCAKQWPTLHHDSPAAAPLKPVFMSGYAAAKAEQAAGGDRVPVEKVDRSGPHHEFERHAEDWHEWSADTSDRKATGELIGKPKRIFLRNQDGCCDLVESAVTSENPGARELEGEREFALYLGRGLAEWLHRALGKALAIDSKPAASEPLSPTTEELVEMVSGGIEDRAVHWRALDALSELAQRVKA